MSQHSNFRGCLWMVAGGLLFVAVTVLVRLLGSDMPAVQAAFIRYLIGVILVLPMLWRMRFRGFGLTRGSIRLYALRGLVHGVAVMLWFFAMARIPLAEVTAIGFSTPVFTALGAILIFHEQVKARRMLAIAAGFIGTLVILRPGLQSIEAGFAGAAGSSTVSLPRSFLLTKRLTQQRKFGTDILVMLSIFCTLALLPGALYVLATSRPWVEISLAGRGRGVCDYRALCDYACDCRSTVDSYPAAVVPATGVGQLRLATGCLPKCRTPGSSSVVLIIVAAVSYLTHREAQVARRE